MTLIRRKFSVSLRQIIIISRILYADRIAVIPIWLHLVVFKPDIVNHAAMPPERGPPSACSTDVFETMSRKASALILSPKLAIAILAVSNV